MRPRAPLCLQASCTAEPGQGSVGGRVSGPHYAAFSPSQPTSSSPAQPAAHSPSPLQGPPISVQDSLKQNGKGKRTAGVQDSQGSIGQEWSGEGRGRGEGAVPCFDSERLIVEVQGVRLWVWDVPAWHMSQALAGRSGRGKGAGTARGLTGEAGAVRGPAGGAGGGGNGGRYKSGRPHRRSVARRYVVRLAAPRWLRRQAERGAGGREGHLVRLYISGRPVGSLPSPPGLVTRRVPPAGQLSGSFQEAGELPGSSGGRQQPDVAPVADLTCREDNAWQVWGCIIIGSFDYG